MPPRTRVATGSRPVPTHSFVDLTQTLPTTDQREMRRRKLSKLSGAAEGECDEPPIFTVDLDSPPRERYIAVATHFAEEIHSLTGLFDDLIHDFIHPKCPVAPFNVLARLLLRKLSSKEETEEVRGISRVTGVSMHLLVAFNLLLDILMGCSSGGVRVKDSPQARSRMMHYRTLDWGMEPLRDIIVQLHFRRGPSSPVIARVVTYAGYVGVLTGIRPGLSLSLNFRAEHDTSSVVGNARYVHHLLLVLLGRRASISSVLRTHLFHHAAHEKDDTLQSHIDALLPIPTPAAFVILATPDETAVIEKDLSISRVLRSDTFIAATNNDARHDDSPTTEKTSPMGRPAAIEGLIAESVHRKACMRQKWHEAQRRRRGGHSSAGDEETVTMKDVVRWINDWPITNECTHYACLMDPASGEIAWCRRRVEVAWAPEGWAG